MMRVAIYARVSSEEQVEGFSLDAQLRACRKFCADNGWTIIEEYIEEGRSARTENIKKRPQFKKMMEDAERGLFDVVLVHKLDRFARNLRVTLENFERLVSFSVCFTSINENMDFTTPWGKLALTMLSGLAQFYSDNLGLEVKKGKGERKAQGLYNGLLPFGTMKGDDGIPTTDAATFPGLQMAFELAAKGKSDKDVAIAINQAGYRTAGNQGNRPFSKDSVRGMLVNRFYLGELPDGTDGWIEGRHKAFVDEGLFFAVQKARYGNRKSPKTVNRDAKTYSLSGLMICDICESRIRIHQSAKGRTRVFCSGRAQGRECTCKGTFLDTYESQVEWYLEQFVIPEDYQQRIIVEHAKSQKTYGELEKTRTALENRLKRTKEIYVWGDLSKEEYRIQRDAILGELRAIPLESQDERTLEMFAGFLKNVVEGWREGSQEQRNRIARALFNETKVRDTQVVAIKPIPELEPFFRVSYECQLKSIAGDPDRIRTGDLCLDRAVC